MFKSFKQCFCNSVYSNVILRAETLLIEDSQSCVLGNSSVVKIYIISISEMYILTTLGFPRT